MQHFEFFVPGKNESASKKPVPNEYGYKSGEKCQKAENAEEVGGGLRGANRGIVFLTWVGNFL